jgi:hypothetical protein
LLSLPKEFVLDTKNKGYVFVDSFTKETNIFQCDVNANSSKSLW